MRHLTLVLAIVVAIGLGVGLFWAKVQVQALEDERSRLDGAVVAERQAIRVLNAEWALLNDPARLRALAETHLDLVPVRARQIEAIADVAMVPVGADGGKPAEARHAR